MTKVKKITVSNLKAISALTADFNGCTAIITGGNNKGKSSFLKSLPERLRGNKPDIVLKQGETEGNAEWELTTGEKFIWSFDGKKEKLTYVSDKNIPSAVTKAISQNYFPAVFDVDEFLNSAPAKQKKVLQEITGIDFSEIDALYKDAYDQRTYLNKVAAEAKARLVFYDPKMSTEIEPVDKLQEELNGIDAHNLRYQSISDKVNDKRQQIAQKQEAIKKLQEQIKQLQSESDELVNDCTKGDAWMAEEKNKPKTNAQELKEKIEKIKQSNKNIEENIKAKELQDAYELALKHAAEQDAEVKRIEAEKLDVIKNASMPDGFGFSEDGITYNGLPFNKEQLSSSSIYKGALKLAATQLGEVKTLFFDASYLDKNSLKEIEEWAEGEGLQLLIERPDFEGGEISYEIIHTLK